MKNILIIIFLLLILGVMNYNIFHKEQVLANGKTILLELAPKDPRSLMQGDYMTLRYKIAQDLPHNNRVENSDGFLVIRIAVDKRVSFVRFYTDNYQLENDEVLLKYRKRERMLKLGAESFFFQEGHAKTYQSAKYGELKVDKSGESILVGLRDEKLNVLGRK